MRGWGGSAALAEGGQMGQIEQWKYTSWRSQRKKSQVWDLQKNQGCNKEGSSRSESYPEF